MLLRALIVSLGYLWFLFSRGQNRKYRSSVFPSLLRNQTQTLAAQAQAFHGLKSVTSLRHNLGKKFFFLHESFVPNLSISTLSWNTVVHSFFI